LRKNNQFIKELNARQAEDDGEENSKIVQERILKKQLQEKANDKKAKKERKKIKKLQKASTVKEGTGTGGRKTLKEKIIDMQMESLRLKIQIRKFIDHYTVVIFMTLLTIYALFFDDLRILFFSK
jgi:mannitol-specific phosphotransferase system IIBC component